MHTQAISILPTLLIHTRAKWLNINVTMLVTGQFTKEQASHILVFRDV